jgi:hypothetical protein
MPRRKTISKRPEEVLEVLTDEGEVLNVEVWTRYPDEGQRGAHKRRLSAELLGIAMEQAARELFESSSEHQRQHRQDLIDGKRGALAKVVIELTRICHKKGWVMSRSTKHKVALDVKRNLTALQNARAKALA